MSDGTAADLEPPLSKEQLLLIAPIFVGCLLSYLLMGVSIVQLYIYHVSYAADSRIIRYSVYGIFIADIAQSVAVAGHGYGTLVEQWGRPKAGALMYWWNGPMPILSSTLALWCQTFYAWRIRQLGGWTVVPAIILFLSLAQTGAAYAIGTVAPSLTKGSELHRPNMTARTIIWLAGGALSDVMIMLSMVFLLLSTRSNGFILRRSELLINRLLRISVETGCFCAITAMLELITFLALPDTSLHFVFSFMLGKVYANTLMASLNSRRGPAPWTRDGRRYDSQGVSLPQFQNTSIGTSDSRGDSEGVVFTTVLDISPNGVSSAGHSEDKVHRSIANSDVIDAKRC